MQGLLHLRANSCMPINNNKEKVVCEFIKNIENNLKYLPANIRQSVRNHSIPIIEKPTFLNLLRQPID